MPIVVTILLVVSVSETSKHGLFWIVYNNYSIKALLNSFELYLSVLSIMKASQKINCQTCRRKIAISHDCFELNGSKKLLSFHYHILL